MKERFEGTENKGILIEALKAQAMVRYDEALATLLAEKGTVREFARGEDLIVQNAQTVELYFILMGKVGIITHQAQHGIRNPNEHVGEMAAIETSLPRSATVRALETVVALELSRDDFIAASEKFPKVWIPISKVLAKRLYERNDTIQVPNPEPRIFIISSKEALSVAHAIENNLKTDIAIKVWDKGVFFLGGYPLEALEKELTEHDFAIAVAEADDVVTSRKTTSPTVRDNVVFELGLFMGKLSRYRAVLVHPKVDGLKLPSDVDGLTVIRYEPGDSTTVDARVKPVCDQLRELVSKAGTLKFTFPEKR